MKLDLLVQIEMIERNDKQVRTYIELVGAIAVLIGLIFVGFELRQNTNAVQAATFQGMTDTSSDFLITIAAEPDLRRVWSSAFVSPDDLSREDRQILRPLQNSFWLRMQNAFRQWQIGTLSDEDWLVYRDISCGFVKNSLFEEYVQNSVAMTASFKEMLEGCDK